VVAVASEVPVPRRLQRPGANVVIASLPPDSIPPVVQEVEALGVAGLGLTVDVSNAEQVKSMVDQTLAKFGRVDILITWLEVLTAETRTYPRLNARLCSTSLRKTS
jgi:NAD(P)-dependent dehydrogenase (short-subunit alcohol dehydrogenase family)